MSIRRRNRLLASIGAVGVAVFLLFQASSLPAGKPLPTDRTANATLPVDDDEQPDEDPDAPDEWIDPGPPPYDPDEGEVGEGPEEGDETARETEEIRGRSNWFWLQRAGDGQTLPRKAWQRAQRQATQLVDPTVLATDPLSWAELGPRPINPATFTEYEWSGSTPLSGRVTAIATHPNDEKIAYIGTPMGGVWKTTNGGVDWAPVFDAAPAGASMAIGAIAIDPANPETLYVGTGEANFNYDGYFGTGLYRSLNGGGDWQKIGNAKFDRCSFSGIAVKPGSPDTILVAVGELTKQYPTQTAVCGYNAGTGVGAGGVYKTTNGGGNAVDWSRVRPGTPTDLIVAPNQPDVWYAAFYGEGVYKSTSSGNVNTWVAKPVATGLTNIGRIEITAVAAASITPTQTVYAALANTSDGLIGIYRSDDGGGLWVKMKKLPPTFYGYDDKGQPEYKDFCAPQCDYDLTLAADPANPNRLYAGGVMLARYDGPQTVSLIGFGWTDFTAGCPASTTTTTKCIHVDFHASAIDKAGRFWVGSDGGVYRSSDGGVNFTNLNGKLGNIEFYPGISGSLANGGLLVGGAQDNGSSKITSGPSGTYINGADGAQALVLGNRHVVMTSTQQGAVYRQYDGVFCKWESAFAEVGVHDQVNWAAPLVGTAASQGTAYFGSYKVYRTTTADKPCGQMTWQALNSGFLNGGAPDRIWSIGVSPDGTTVYAGTNSGKIYVKQGTGSFTLASTGLPGRLITDIWVSSDPKIAYATTGGYNTGQHLYVTSNFGASWQNVSGNLPDFPALSLTVDAGVSPATIYVGMDVGVYWSIDGGGTWQNTSLGLPRVPVNDLLLDLPSNKLIGATFGRGMWKATPIGRGPTGPINDSFTNAKTIAGVPYTDTSINTATASLPAEPGEILDQSCSEFMGKTVWYKFLPSTTMTVTADTQGSGTGFDTVIVAYKGTALNTLVPVGCNDDPPGLSSTYSKLEALRVDAGSTYYFQVGGWRETSGGTPSSGALTFHLTSAGPINDFFVNAKVVGPLTFADTVATGQASEENGENIDQSCSEFLGKTVWYKFTPASSTTIAVDTQDSEAGFDTVIVAYQGLALASLTPIACNDDPTGLSGTYSKINSLAVTGGQTYYFQVGGWRETSNGVPESGTLKFRIAPAASSNDAFAGATTISALPFTGALTSNTQATTEGNEDLVPSCATGIGKTIWYRFQPGSSMNISLNTSGATFDTVLVVYQGTTIGGLTEVACDDDGGGGSGPSSISSLSVVAGQTYYIQVGGWKGATGEAYAGTFQLHVSQLP